MLVSCCFLSKESYSLSSLKLSLALRILLVLVGTIAVNKGLLFVLGNFSEMF